MTQLEMHMESEDEHLTADGDIFAKKAGPSDPPTIDEVIARNLRCSRFVLTAGKYVYLFSLLNGSGKGEVSVRNAATGAKLKKLDVDASVRSRSIALHFEVK